MPKKFVVKAAEVTVRLANAAPIPVPTLPLKFTAARLPAFTVKPKAPTMVDPKVMVAPAGNNCVVATLEVAVSVTPPVPKFTGAPLVTVAAKLDAALPVKSKPSVNANVSRVALPKVTPEPTPVLRKSMFDTNVLVAPVMVTVYGLAVVIRSFT